jgi:hypothetical protein
MARKMLRDGEAAVADGGGAEESYEYDLFVIGAGSGGVRGSRTSAGFGAKVRSLLVYFSPPMIPSSCQCVADARRIIRLRFSAGPVICRPGCDLRAPVPPHQLGVAGRTRRHVSTTPDYSVHFWFWILERLDSLVLDILSCSEPACSP